MSMIRDRIGGHEILLPTNHNRYNFQVLRGIIITIRIFDHTKIPRVVFVMVIVINSLIGGLS